jgi:hypothetical protein
MYFAPLHVSKEALTLLDPSMHRKLLAVIFALGLLSIAGSDSAPKKPCKEATQFQDCGRRFVCTADVCSSCTSDSQCELSYSWLACSQTGTGATECDHKGIFPISESQIICSMLSLVVGSIAAGGGMGGTACITAILVIFARFTPAHAIPITRGFVFGSAFTTL